MSLTTLIGVPGCGDGAVRYVDNGQVVQLIESQIGVLEEEGNVFGIE